MSRQEAALGVLAVLAFAIQFSGLSLNIGPQETPRTTIPVVVGDPAAPSAAELGLLWREFRPGQHLTEAQSGVICGAALQRSPGAAALIVRFCTNVPTTPLRRYGLGYDSLVIEALLPGGAKLSYDLVDFTSSGPDRGQAFAQGPTGDNSIPVSTVFVRDATDVVIVFGTGMVAGLPVVSVRGRLNSTAFAETDVFEPLGPIAELVPLEVAHSLTAPKWAADRP